MKLKVKTPDGQTHEIDGIAGWRAMEAIRDNGLPVRAECGGCCACATCHVHVKEEWLSKLPPQSEDEKALLSDSFELQPNSRLSCQIILTPEMDGIEMELAKDAV